MELDLLDSIARSKKIHFVIGFLPLLINSRNNRTWLEDFQNIFTKGYQLKINYKIFIKIILN